MRGQPREVDAGLERVADASYRATGDLTFTTVQGLHQAGVRMIDDADGTITIDLSGVERADSAGVALLVEWVRTAREAGKGIRFLRVPDQMCAIARVSGVATILPFEEE